MRKIRLILALPAWGKLIFLETVCYSLYAAFLLNGQKDYRKIDAVLQKSLPGKDPEKSRDGQQEMKIIRMVGSAIQTVAKYTPWRNVCYHQVIQAKLMLHKRGIPCVIRIGFKKNDQGKIEGHAWTKSGDRIITGFCREEDYTILTEF